MNKAYHNSGSTFVPALPSVRQEIIHIPPPTNTAELLPPVVHSAYARSDDSAITHAKATLLVSSAYIAAAGMITVGLLLIVWLFRGLGDHWPQYGYTGLIVWGLCVLGALWGNRRQSLHHSPTGIAHHELDSRERIARHAIDTHAAMLLRRWEIDSRDH
jgi:hypothetical protein